jgi:hypothetical protein
MLIPGVAFGNWIPPSRQAGAMILPTSLALVTVWWTPVGWAGLRHYAYPGGDQSVPGADRWRGPWSISIAPHGGCGRCSPPPTWRISIPRMGWQQPPPSASALRDGGKWDTQCLGDGQQMPRIIGRIRFGWQSVRIPASLGTPRRRQQCPCRWRPFISSLIMPVEPDATRC